jgi:hypothetical protein
MASQWRRQQNQESHQHNPIHTQKRHSPRLQERCHVWIIRVQRTAGEVGKEQDKIHMGGDCINYPGALATPTADMLVAKLLFKSVISTKGA